MRGLWLEDGELTLRDDLPSPEPAEGEALVRVVTAGVCNTDLELVRGYYPYRGILGHEFVGIVEEGPEELAGKRVVGEINAVCHDCRHCRSGRPTHCERRTVLGIVGRDGAFADLVSLPPENLHPVPDGLDTDAAVFTEPLAAALEIQQQVRVGPDDRVLLVGDGKLGQLIARTLALTGCELTVVGRDPRKLGALEALGIETVRSERGEAEPPVPAGVFDLAVEATGDPAGFALARRALRPRGTLVLKSTYAGELTLDAASLVVDEITLVGSRCGPFAPALRLLESGRVDPRDLVDDRFPLDDGVAAFERSREAGVLKVLLDVASA